MRDDPEYEAYVAAQSFWQRQGPGVRLAHPMTITVRVGTGSGKATTTGVVGVGVYVPD